jgi:hypothetical protein
MDTLCPCSLNVSKPIGLKKIFTERKMCFIFLTTLARYIFQSATETPNDPVRERKRWLKSVCWRRRLFSWTTSEVSQILVRLTPDASSDPGSSNSDSCLQRYRSVCYTCLGSKTLEYHYHTAMISMAAYLLPSRPLLDQELNVDLNLYNRQNTRTGPILRDNVYGNSCRSPLAHFLTSIMPPPLSSTSLWSSAWSCLDMWSHVLHWARITCQFWSTSCADHLFRNPQSRQ